MTTNESALRKALVASVIGEIPQDLKFNGEKTRLVIGRMFGNPNIAFYQTISEL